MFSWPEIAQLRADDLQKLREELNRAIVIEEVDDRDRAVINGRLLMQSAARVAEKHIHKTQNEACAVEYKEDNLEYWIWAIGLMSIAWTDYIFWRKAKDGHCWAHRTPCRIGGEFHASIRNHVVTSLKRVLELIEARQTELPE